MNWIKRVGGTLAAASLILMALLVVRRIEFTLPDDDLEGFYPTPTCG